MLLEFLCVKPALFFPSSVELYKFLKEFEFSPYAPYTALYESVGKSGFRPKLVEILRLDFDGMLKFAVFTYFFGFLRFSLILKKLPYSISILFWC